MKPSSYKSSSFCLWSMDQIQTLPPEIIIEMEMEMEMKRGRLIDDLKVLPPEIIIEIISRLPADAAVGCRRVCKQWRTLIDNPSFVDTHTRQVISSSFNPKKSGNYLVPTSSSGFFLFADQGYGSFGLEFIEYNDDEGSLVPDFKLINKPISDHPFPLSYGNCSNLLISSCNGLVFMGPTKPNDISVCNPFTRKYVNLRNPITIAKNYKKWSRQTWGSMTYGFGYNPCTNEYKIVSIYYDCYPSSSKIGKGKVSVYTLGSGKWRNKRKKIPYNLLSIHHQPGLLANGAIHWYTNHDNDKKIVSFDLADEEFKIIVPLPPPPPAPYYFDHLGMLGGCLCVTRSRNTVYKESPRDVWILNFSKKEKEEEVEFSWNMKFSIPWKKENVNQPKPCVVLKSGKILLYGGNTITSYDPKNEEAIYEDVSITPNSKGFCTMIPCTKSFVSLEALGEEDTKCFSGFVAHALAQHQQG